MTTSRRREKVGILGGTFNPIHFGHLLIAQDAMEQAGLDRVKFIPSATPPHKKVDKFASAAHRIRMIKLGIRGNERFELDDIEIRRGGISYSVDTLTALRQRHPGTQFYFIIGTDSLLELHLWREIGRLGRLCRFVAVARPGFKATKADFARQSPAVAGIKPIIIQGHACDIASREVRSRIARGQPIRYLVPDAVARYIEEQKFYR